MGRPSSLRRIACCLCVLLSALAGPSACSVWGDPPDGSQRRPLAELTDEFEGESLDVAKWHDHNPTWKGRQPGFFSKENVRFYVDGKAVRTLANTHWHQPLSLNFDSETMPNWFGLPKPENLPSTFSIEYVRSWQKVAATGSEGEVILNAK